MNLGLVGVYLQLPYTFDIQSYLAKVCDSVRESTDVINLADVIKKRCPSGQANIKNVIHNNSFWYRCRMQPCQILFYIEISSEILPRCYTCHFMPSYVAMWPQRLVSPECFSHTGRFKYTLRWRYWKPSLNQRKASEAEVWTPYTLPN